jgi:hypothetical protein
MLTILIKVNFYKNSYDKKYTKGVIRNRKSKDKQYNGQKKKDQGTNNDLQSEGQTIQWTKEKRPRDKQ